MKITAANLVLLCESEASRFAALAGSGHPTVRVNECLGYKLLYENGSEWARTRNPEEVITVLTLHSEGKQPLCNELQDAFYDGGLAKYFEDKPEDESDGG